MMDRDWINVAGPHDHVYRRFVGGCNAGCGDPCRCSVPVYACDCGDVDYGDNDEADDIRKHCAALTGKE